MLDPNHDTLTFFQLTADYTETAEHGTELELFGLLRHSSEPCLVRVHGFDPHFWVRAPANADPELILPLLNTLLRQSVLPRDYGLDEDDGRRGEQMCTMVHYTMFDKQALRKLYSFPDWIVGFTREYHRNFMGYDGQQIQEFWNIRVRHPKLVHKLRLLFENPQGVSERDTDRQDKRTPRWSDEYTSSHFQVYEANVDYILRFFCDHDWKPSSWFQVSTNCYTVVQPTWTSYNYKGSTLYRSQRKSTCRQEIQCHVRELLPLADLNETEQPETTILSFDAEMDSGGFVFPRAQEHPVISVGANVCLLSEPHRSHTVLFLLKETSQPETPENMERPLTAYCYESEREMLMHFMAFVLAVDPDWFVHYNGNGFDLPYLKERARVLQLQCWPKLGRSIHRAYYTKQARQTHVDQKTPAELEAIAKQARKSKALRWAENVKREKKVQRRDFMLKMKDEAGVPGRVNVDMIIRMREDHTFESNRLGYTSQQILGITKTDFDVGLIHTFFQQPTTRLTIALYLEADCYLPAEMFVKLNHMQKLVAVSRISRTPIQICLNKAQEAKLSGRLRQEAHHRQVVVEVDRQERESIERLKVRQSHLLDDDQNPEPHAKRPCVTLIPGSTLPKQSTVESLVKLLKEVTGQGSNIVHKYKGARVIDPRRGYYGDDPVATLDFASEYPSIMRESNLCYTTRLTLETIERLGLVENVDYFKWYHNWDPVTLEKIQDDEFDAFILAPDPEQPLDSRTNRFRVRGLLPSILDALATERKRLRRLSERWFASAELAKRLLEKGPRIALATQQDQEEFEFLLSDCFVEQRSFALSRWSVEHRDRFDTLSEEDTERLKSLVRERRAWALFQYRRLDSEQLQVKLLMNSAYGICGATLSAYGMKAIARTVTSIGRYRLFLIKREIEKEFRRANGYPFDTEVIYGDTDSAFIWMKNFQGCYAQACYYGIRMADYMNKWFGPPTNLEFEKILMRLDLIRKKNYIANKIELNTLRDKVCAMGVRSKKRGTPPFIRLLCNEVFQRIVLNGDIEGTLAFCRERLKDLCHDRVPLAQLVCGATLGKNIEAYDDGTDRAPPVSVVMAKRMRKRYGTSIRAGDRVTWIVLEGPNGERTGGAGRYHKLSVGKRVEEVKQVLEHPERHRVDRHFYLDQTMKMLCRILGPVLGDLTDKCPTVWRALLGVSRLTGYVMPVRSQKLNTPAKKQKNLLTRWTVTPSYYCCLCDEGIAATDIRQDLASQSLCRTCFRQSDAQKTAHRHALLDEYRRAEQKNEQVWQTCVRCYKDLVGVDYRSCTYYDCSNQASRVTSQLEYDRLKQKWKRLEW